MLQASCSAAEIYNKPNPKQVQWKVRHLLFPWVSGIFWLQLVENIDVEDILERYDVYVLPAINADGYIYTHTTVSVDNFISIQTICINCCYF